MVTITFSFEEVREFLGCCKRHLKVLADLGLLKPIRIQPSTLRFRTEDVSSFRAHILARTVLPDGTHTRLVSLWSVPVRDSLGRHSPAMREFWQRVIAREIRLFGDATDEHVIPKLRVALDALPVKLRRTWLRRNRRR